MPSWNEVLNEIQICSSKHPLDVTRRKYLNLLSEHTGRNVICYYSGWLQKPGAQNAHIMDDDKNGLMAAVHKLDRSLGLDLILHTPGGDIAATESFVHYIREMFGTNIRVIIPQIAMSAGTMIACSSKQIIMGKQSNIGPIDPQFGGIPAHGVIEEFKKAVEEIKANPAAIPLWQTIISKYHPTFIGECEKAIELSDILVESWLTTGMFEGEADAQGKAKKIINALNNHGDTKTHSRHIHYGEGLAMGLKIEMLEDSGNMQDLVLTVHHAYMHTLANSPAVKIIENNLGNAVVINLAS